jgi:hypothetical protein
VNHQGHEVSRRSLVLRVSFVYFGVLLVMVLPLLEFGGNKEFLGRVVEFDAQHVWLATDLAVFHIALTASCGLINGGRIPLSAGRALEA